MPPHISDIIDWICNVLVGVGAPGAVVWFVRDRRRAKAESRKVESSADLDEATITDKIESSSITTINNRVALLLKIHDAEKTALNSTIEHQAEQLMQRDGRIEQLEALRAELTAEIEQLQRELASTTRDFAARLQDMSQRLTALQGEGV